MPCHEPVDEDFVDPDDSWNSSYVSSYTESIKNEDYGEDDRDTICVQDLYAMVLFDHNKNDFIGIEYKGYQVSASIGVTHYDLGNCFINIPGLFHPTEGCKERPFDDIRHYFNHSHCTEYRNTLYEPDTTLSRSPALNIMWPSEPCCNRSMLRFVDVYQNLRFEYWQRPNCKKLFDVILNCQEHKKKFSTGKL